MAEVDALAADVEAALAYWPAVVALLAALAALLAALVALKSELVALSCAADALVAALVALVAAELAEAEAEAACVVAVAVAAWAALSAICDASSGGKGASVRIRCSRLGLSGTVHSESRNLEPCSSQALTAYWEPATPSALGNRSTTTTPLASARASMRSGATRPL